MPSWTTPFDVPAHGWTGRAGVSCITLRFRRRPVVFIRTGFCFVFCCFFFVCPFLGGIYYFDDAVIITSTVNLLSRWCLNKMQFKVFFFCLLLLFYFNLLLQLFILIFGWVTPLTDFFTFNFSSRPCLTFKCSPPPSMSLGNYVLPSHIIRFLNLGISECLGVTERMFWKY